MEQSKILEIGQADFSAVLKDYQIAKLSFQHFSAAYGELDTDNHPVRDAINSARIGDAFDWILNVLLYDALMAVARLTDNNSQRGGAEKVMLLTIQARLKEKRDESPSRSLLSQIDSVNSQITQFRNSDIVQRLRSHRDSHLAHRLCRPPEELTYGEIISAILELSGIFEKLAPLFRATKGWSDALPDGRKHATDQFWDAVRLGAEEKALEFANQTAGVDIAD